MILENIWKYLSAIQYCTSSLPYLLCLWTQSCSVPYCHRGLVRMSIICRRHQQNPPLFWSNSTRGSVYGLAVLLVVLGRRDEAEVFLAYIHKDQLQKEADLQKEACFLHWVVQQSYFIHIVLWPFVLSFPVQLKADCNKGYVTVKQVRFCVRIYSISGIYWDSCCT